MLDYYRISIEYFYAAPVEGAAPTTEGEAVQAEGIIAN